MRSNYIIDHNITDPIVKWTNDNQGVLDTNNSHEGLVYGKYHLEKNDLELNKLAFPYDNLKSLEKEIKIHYNLPDTEYESYFGILLIFAPACLNSYKAIEHIDTNNYDGNIHTRFNVMISLPEKGGYAVIEDNVIIVEENEPWICIAGLHKHSTVKIEGTKNRIMISFGYWYSREFLESRGWVDMYKNLEI
jgi:hypothetical protein